jgi:hypothetical protein
LQFHRNNVTDARTPAFQILLGSLQKQGIAGLGLKQYLDVELGGFVAQPTHNFIVFQTLPWTCQPIPTTTYPVQYHIVFPDFGKRVKNSGA